MPQSSNLHLYAHCLPDRRGGISLLAINTDTGKAQSIELSAASEVYALTARNLTDKHLQLNGVELKLGEDNVLPSLKGIDTPEVK